jgi:hypothetical protein
MPGFDEGHILAFAAMASSDGGQDPVDAAIRAAAAHQKISETLRLISFIPFDPSNKTSEATFADSSSANQRVVKGAFSTIVSLAPVSATAGAAAKELDEQGFRVLAVASGPTGAMKMVGLIALSDPARADSKPYEYRTSLWKRARDRELFNGRRFAAQTDREFYGTSDQFPPTLQNPPNLRCRGRRGGR